MSTIAADKSQTNRAVSRNDGRASLSDLREDVVQVKDDVVKLKDDALDAAAGMASSAVKTVKSGAEAALDTGRKALSDVKSFGEQVTEFISERPTTSVLIALGLGAIAYRLLRGK